MLGCALATRPDSPDLENSHYGLGTHLLGIAHSNLGAEHLTVESERWRFTMAPAALSTSVASSSELNAAVTNAEKVAEDLKDLKLKSVGVDSAPLSNGNGFQHEELESEEEEEEEHWEFREDKISGYDVDPKDADTPDRWIKRHPQLVRLTGRHPFNCEPPLPKLMQHGFITPVSLHYVRNHGAVPKCDWDEWRVEVGGLVKRPTSFSMADLLSMPSRTLPVTLVCAGNRRKEQNMVKQTIGFNWGAGGVSTSVWKGVKLRDLLLKCGILSRSKGAHYVCLEGSENLPGGGGSKYATSVARESAMDDSQDIILAYEQNGKPLEPDHGFPIRMIIPGYIGGRMVKWLRKITVTEKESNNHYHYNDNRVLPSHVDAETATAEGWWYKPEYIINQLNINSVITTPFHGEVIPISADSAANAYKIRGYAYSGGGRKVTRVEVSFNDGETWNLCKVVHPERPTKYGKYWCWCFWSLEVDLMLLLQSKEFVVRAWDSGMNTQPQRLTWNVMGMMNNCWFRVRVHPTRHQNGGLGLGFEHPTKPGNEIGGWMVKSSEEDRKASVPPLPPMGPSSVPQSKLKKSTSSPSLVEPSVRKIPMSEVRKHDNETSAWIVVHGKVYDCTPFLQNHPGGAESILINAGTDATEEFDAIHSAKAKAMLEDYYIGDLTTLEHDPRTPEGSVRGGSKFSSFLGSITEAPSRPPVALNPKERVPLKLIEKHVLSHDTRRFRFALQTPDHILGLPVGKHMYLSAQIDDKFVMRAYTPTSSDDETGYFDLVIKVYFKGVVPQFPLGGLMSQYLESLAIGDTIDVKGPVGHIEYTGKGNLLVNGKPKFASGLAMLAGGTGITPMYQVIQAIVKDPEDDTQVHLIFCNRSEDDVLLQSELEAWDKEYPNIHVWFTIDKKTNPEAEWKYSVDRLNEQLMREKLPPGGQGSLALMCGPPGMIKFACVPNLEKMGYPAEDMITF